MLGASAVRPAVDLFIRAGATAAVLHALCALALCGTSVHQAVYALRLFTRPLRRVRLTRCRLFSRLVLLSYLAVVGWRALVSRAIATSCAALYLDRCAPGVEPLRLQREPRHRRLRPFAVAAFFWPARCISSRPADHKDDSQDGRFGKIAWWPSTPALPSLAVVVGFNSIAGLLVASVRRSGTPGSAVRLRPHVVPKPSLSPRSLTQKTSPKKPSSKPAAVRN